MTRRLVAALHALLLPSLAGAQVSFRAERARLTPGHLSLDHVWANAGSSVLVARSLDRCDGAVRASEVTVWPCGCLPVGVSARAASLTSPTSLTLEHPSIALGPLRIPLGPRGWLVWGDRVGLLLPRVAWRDGVSAGPGVHVPLGATASLDAWLLARGDGAELQSVWTLGGSLALDLRWTTADVALRARGALTHLRGDRVIALRAEGATSARAAALFAARAGEILRPASEAAVGVSVQSAGAVSSDVELTRAGDDLRARAVVSLATPTLSHGRSTLALRAATGSDLFAPPDAFSDVEFRARALAAAGPFDLSTELRGEALLRGARLDDVGRAVAAVELPLARRVGALYHGLRVRLAGAAEGGSDGARAVLLAHATSALRGPRWSWTIDARGLLSSDRGLAPRVALSSVLSARWVSVEAEAVRDEGWSHAELRASVRDARGDRLSLGGSFRARSPWDGHPAWDDDGAGPMDLQGVRARRVLGAAARASVAVSLGAGISVRVEPWVDLARPALALVEYGVAWRARCGCATLGLGGLWSESAGSTAMLSVRAAP